MEIRGSNLGKRGTLLLSAAIVIFWIAAPLYLSRHGFSAVQVSFAVTVIYYLGFKLWKRTS
jgi:hypothetical protein